MGLCWIVLVPEPGIRTWWPMNYPASGVPIGAIKFRINLVDWWMEVPINAFPTKMVRAESKVTWLV